MGNFLNFLGDLGSSAATDLLSSGINYAFDTLTAQQNFEMAEQSAANQYQRQLDFWNKQNLYNSPKSQVNRRLAAGLAPTENIDSGNASNLSTVPGNEYAQSGVRRFQSNIDLLDSLRTTNEIRNMTKQGTMLDKQIGMAITDGLLKQMVYDLEKSGKGELAQRIKGLMLDNERKQRENNNLYTDEYYTNFLNDLRNQWQMRADQAFILNKDRNYYEKHGVHPDRASSTSGPARMVQAILPLISELLGVDMDSDTIRDITDFISGATDTYNIFFHKGNGKKSVRSGKR